MKQPVLTSLLTCLTVMTAAAQGTYSIKGRVLDKLTGEELPGATVQVTGNGVNTGAGTEASGSYAVPNLKPGTYVVRASFIGYKPSEQTVTIGSQNAVATFRLGADNATLNEVQVVGSLGIAVERETPVAYSAVNEVKLRETLSNRDLPLVLNETPGVYATQGGGGSGDSRISIRGFDQRNVAVMVNGVPVNDMENGSVYWSNWDLGDVTKSLQVQRGLSASRIAVPSVGGTINVLTRGFDDKKSVLARMEGGSNGYRKASLMMSSGTIKGDWAFTAYGSRRVSNGWVDNAFDDAWTYFGNISKKFGAHRLSLTGMGSPQSHGQRSFASRIGVYSNDKARELGATAVRNGGDKGFSYNPNWGYLRRYRMQGTERVYESDGAEVINERINYYHKPQINLNHYWNATDRLFISTVAYVSLGTGGGTGASSTLALDANGQADFQRVFDNNYNSQANPTRRALNYLRNNVNNHRWYGFVTGGDYKLTDKLTLAAGVDGRVYYGEHYSEIRDLLGGEYATNAAGTRDLNRDNNTRLYVGDKVSFNYDGETQWVGTYGQLEYKTPVLSAVLSATASQIGYKRIDYFKAREVNVDGQSRPIIFGQTYTAADGTVYTNADGKYVETDWARLTGYSVKGGVNYNLTEHNNLFVNMGYISKVPFFNFVFDQNSGRKLPDIKNEGIASFELGYGISYSSLKANLNGYLTNWTNKSSSSTGTVDGVPVFNNVRNVNARHMGVELDIAQEISRRVQLNAAVSIGDWRWSSTGRITQITEGGEVYIDDKPIYIKGVHVGDAAQNQFQIGLRYEPFTGFYVRPSFLMFSKYYANFDPVNLTTEANRTDSYRIPTSRNLDFHFGYEAKAIRDRYRLSFKASILNVLDQYYITDVPTRSVVDPTNVNSLEAFFNRGRTFTVGMAVGL
ncbi:TonB-dependent receptor [Hymenobacter psychrotolerans]|uniref:TonB-dependent Receptor Plug Domain n=1 Tax=Hymenobacter psychrotolerans DSM 18569 TaxID=1121959 RepID=A0A1M7ATX8_9BACT|nr:TonB-dependent receptor [Hymenobacter psychrotolerans]SHL46183.1 TonB-dependent Receptor Plug Domain [Hymenobacter psychrotolerans DSM 18569]